MDTRYEDLIAAVGWVIAIGIALYFFSISAANPELTQMQVLLKGLGW